MAVEKGKDVTEAKMKEIREATSELLKLENNPQVNIAELKEKTKELLSRISKIHQPDEKQFIIAELKKKGYPLENYVQWLLALNGWHVQPNMYFHDKDEDTGRELDIKAWKTTIVSTTTSFYLNLFIQCKKLPGQAWIFFPSPEDQSVYSTILRSTIADSLAKFF